MLSTPTKGHHPMINFDDGIDNLDLSDELERLACNENFKLPFRLIGPSDDEGPKIIVDADYVDLVRIPYGAPPMRNVVYGASSVFACRCSERSDASISPCAFCANAGPSWAPMP